MGLEIKVTNNAKLALDDLKSACLRALERMGQQAEGYAIDLVPSPGKTGTGALKNSLTHKVVPSELTVYAGSDMPYAGYVECGTGKYYPGGRDTPWVYQDVNGKWHYTHGQRAQPYLKPAIADHVKTYQNITEEELRGK